MSTIKETNEKMAAQVKEGYKKMEDGIVEGYKKIEKGAVEGFCTMNDAIIGKVFAKEGETVEEARARLKKATGKEEGEAPVKNDYSYLYQAKENLAPRILALTEELMK